MVDPELTPDESAVLSKNPFGDTGLAADHVQAKNRVWRIVGPVSVLFLVVLAAFNVVSVPISESINGSPGPWELLLALGLGMLGGQIGGLSVLLVWSHGPFLVRALLLWLLGMALFGCWVVGLIAATNRDFLAEMWREVARATGASLPAVSLAIQLPHWALRFYSGCRIATPFEDESALVRRPLSIRHLLSGTLITALTLTALRLAFPANQLETEFWIGWAIAFAILSFASAILLIPALLLVLRGFHPMLAVLFIALATPLVTTIAVSIINAIFPGGPDAWGMFLMALAATTCVALSCAPLWLARLAGCRLKFGQKW
jgi:hypothetical protein